MDSVIIDKAGLYAYTLPLARQLIIAGRRLMVRQGLIVRLSDNSGNTGWGEIAPLPGLHSDTLARCQSEVQQWLQSATGREVRLPDFNQFPKTSDGIEALEGLTPATVFGLETALFNLGAAQMQSTLARFWYDKPIKRVAVNGLLMRDLEDVGQQIVALYKQGYRTVKIKVGGISIAREVRRIRRITDILPEAMRLRLDANRSWRLEEAVEFARALDIQKVEYIEEPLRDSYDLGLFYAECGLPWAMDESLGETRWDEIIEQPGLTALVLKPAFLGGFLQTLQRIHRVSSRKISFVISDTFNSGVSIAALTAFAAALRQQGVAMGLATYQYLSEDVLSDRLEIKEGAINVRDAERKTVRLNTQKLTKLYG